MVQRIGGMRRKSRSKFKKNSKDRGKISLSRYFQVFVKGDAVALKAEPAVQEGFYHSRFHGRIGTITGNQGRCYQVTLKDGQKDKKLLVHPVHLKKI
jgi:large subunit ribosomal protein L21e